MPPKIADKFDYMCSIWEKHTMELSRDVVDVYVALWDLTSFTAGQRVA